MEVFAVIKDHGTTNKFVELYLSSLDCPRSLSIWLLFVNNEHKQLVEMDVNPDHYIDSEGFRDAYLATKLLSKADFLSTKIDLKQTALDKFKEAEQRCKEINRRGYHHLTINREIGARLHVAIQRKIDSILGEFSFDELVDSTDWGPGVTLLIKGVDTSPVNKFRKENGTTRPLDDLIGPLYAGIYPRWDLSNRRFFDGNKVVTVPKNSKTDRTIAVEPGLNLWFQKGVGSMIRRRLRWVGINLNSQERNQILSREGSITNHLATVDFSSASDTIAESTVRELLPNGWLVPMDIMRSMFGSLGNHQFRYEKFSSMGNGFTFELESLIFFAIAFSVCKHLQLDTSKVSVYGDDVILPVGAYPLFVNTCNFYGFSVNTQKSFSSGYFRESCGSHWYNGRDCKPFFLKELITGDSRVYRAANGVRRTAREKGFFSPVRRYYSVFNIIRESLDDDYSFCDKRFYAAWRYLRRKVRNPCLIPEGYGDGGFAVNFDEAKPSRVGYGIEGYYTRHLADIAVAYQSDDHAVLLARLWAGNPEMSFGNRTPLRGRVKQKVKKLFVRRWTNFGPWI